MLLGGILLYKSMDVLRNNLDSNVSKGEKGFSKYTNEKFKVI